MLAAIELILRNPALRVATLTLLASGLTYGATLPFLSVVGIHEFGMTDSQLSLLLFAVACANLTYGVVLAIFSDMVADRKPMLLSVLIAGVVGFGLIYLTQRLSVFVLCAVLLVPISNASYSLIFAFVRHQTKDLPGRESTQVNQVVRALFSGSWAIIPGVMAFWLANSPSMLPAWGFSAAVCLAAFALVGLFLPRAPRTEASPNVSFGQSLGMALRPSILGRVAALSLVIASGRLISIIQPLIIVGIAGGTVRDVGLTAGLCAALEIPSMLIWGAALKRLTVLQAMMAGGLIYAVFMALLAVATETWQIYALLLPNAFGISAILSLPMTYYQNLIEDRPGLGTSLNQISAFLSTGMSAAAFAIGGPLLGYSHAAFIGVGMVLVGGGVLLWLERDYAAGSDPVRASADRR
jgi:predicted MFS family arabinose efflux permease